MSKRLLTDSFSSIFCFGVASRTIAGIFAFLLMTCNCFAATSDIPASVRLSYALKFHDAFILQSCGLSTMSFNRFAEA